MNFAKHWASHNTFKSSVLFTYRVKCIVDTSARLIQFLTQHFSYMIAFWKCRNFSLASKIMNSWCLGFCFGFLVFNWVLRSLYIYTGFSETEKIHDFIVQLSTQLVFFYCWTWPRKKIEVVDIHITINYSFVFHFKVIFTFTLRFYLKQNMRKLCKLWHMFSVSVSHQFRLITKICSYYILTMEC